MPPKKKPILNKKTSTQPTSRLGMFEVGGIRLRVFQTIELHINLPPEGGFGQGVAHVSEVIPHFNVEEETCLATARLGMYPSRKNSEGKLEPDIDAPVIAFLRMQFLFDIKNLKKQAQVNGPDVAASPSLVASLFSVILPMMRATFATKLQDTPYSTLPSFPIARLSEILNLIPRDQGPLQQMPDHYL